MSEIKDSKRIARLIVRWKDRVKKYMHERGVDREEGLEQVRKECMDRERWRLCCHGHLLGPCFRGNKVSETR